MNWQFQYPQALWALAAIPLFLLFFLLNIRRKKRSVKKIGDPRLVKELFRSYSPGKFTLKFALLATAFALGCVAVAHPRRPEEGTGSVRKGIDIMVALDVSNSMLAADIHPSRLAAAQALVQQLMSRLPDDRVGLVLFAGTAYVQLPLTFDHDAASLIVSTARPSNFRSQGTAIGDALQKCNLSFGEDGRRFNAVVLITDGETHDENALDAAKDLADKGIMINTVGIGSAAGATIIDTVSGGVKKDLSGNVVVTRLNEQLLQQIAASTNGTYVHLTNPSEAANAIFAQLSQIQKRALGDLSQFNYQTFYFWLAAPMLLLLIAELFIPDRKKEGL